MYNGKSLGEVVDIEQALNSPIFTGYNKHNIETKVSDAFAGHRLNNKKETKMQVESKQTPPQTRGKVNKEYIINKIKPLSKRDINNIKKFK